MYEELFARFTEEFKSSFEDPDIHLSYTDRQRIKAGEHAEVAEEKLPTLRRRIRRLKASAVVAAVLLAAGTVFVGMSEVGDAANWRLENFAFPLFLALCMGVSALAGMQRLLKLEKQRLLCELVVAHSEKERSEEKDKAGT